MMSRTEKYYCTYECQDERKELENKLKAAERKIYKQQKDIQSLRKELKHYIELKQKTHNRLDKLYRDTKDHRESLLYLLNDILLTLQTPGSNTAGTIKDILEALEKYGYFAKTKQEKNKRIREIDSTSSS